MIPSTESHCIAAGSLGHPLISGALLKTLYSKKASNLANQIFCAAKRPLFVLKNLIALMFFVELLFFNLVQNELIALIRTRLLTILSSGSTETL